MSGDGDEWSDLSPTEKIIGGTIFGISQIFGCLVQIGLAAVGVAVLYYVVTGC
jgi:hypothetical protein